MATSQNGWTVLTSAPSGTLPGYVTGRVRDGDVETVFKYLCDRIHDEVEKINPNWSWGWAYRAIRGQDSGFSNHASGTAIDINAPAHPLGVTGTWEGWQINRIHKILADLNGVIRWGEDYSGRKDGMHFEIVKDAAAVGYIARKIRDKKLPGLKPEWEPRDAKPIHFGVVQQEFLIAAGAEKGKPERKNGVGLIQEALNKLVDAKLEVDGVVGKKTLNAWGKWEDRVGGKGRPRVPDRISTEKMVRRAGLDLAGDPWNNKS